MADWISSILIRSRIRRSFHLRSGAYRWFINIAHREIGVSMLNVEEGGMAAARFWSMDVLFMVQCLGHGGRGGQGAARVLGQGCRILVVMLTSY